ncbi:MAG: response regulator [Synechococcales cyanobacterium RM1_1_8]|nr:response regulator [Synechococcales cyanobacterium RM1_1_8]
MLIEQGVTGRLHATPLQSNLPGWFVDIAQGKIQFAGGQDPQGDRLTYLLQRSYRQLLPLLQQQPKAGRSPYAFLHQCWQQGQLSLQDLRQLLRLASEEALIHLLAMLQGRVQFERGVTPDPILISLNFPQAMDPLEEQIAQWQFLGERQISPHRRLSLVRGSRFEEQFRIPLLAQSRARPLPSPQDLLANQPSLYRLAARLNGDVLAIAQLMDQAANFGYLRWLDRDSTQAGGQGDRPGPRSASRCHGGNPGTIACLDSSPAVQRQVRSCLEGAGYRVIGLSYPQQALSILIKERPQLILMDGALASAEEQGLGRLLRGSPLLKAIPLLLLTPHDSLINPIRAKRRCPDLDR